MAWDTDRTRAVLLDASVAEFSEFGLAGARIDRISERAGINRERLYSYFGNKRRLFEAVLADQLTRGLESVEIRGTGPTAIADFAGRHFDACVADPRLPRLIFWEGLENNGAVDERSRRIRSSSKVDEVRAAAPGLGAEEAEDLLLTIVSLSYAWLAAPNLATVVTSASAARRRAAIVALVDAYVRAAAEPRRGGRSHSTEMHGPLI